MRVILFLGFLAYACAEPPAAPYAPSGWKPSKPFNLPNKNPQPQQNYGSPKEEYGPPKQEYGPPKQEYGPPKQEYGPPKQEVYPPTRQELPKPESAKPWKEYGPPPSIQPSISWQIPDDSARFIPEPQPKQEYGPPQEEIIPTTEEQPLEENTNVNKEDEETQRVLEQIKQYRIKASRQQKIRLRNQLGRLRANLQAAPRRPQRLQKQRINNKQFNRFRSERLQEEPQILNEEEVQQNDQTKDYDDTGYESSHGYLPSRKYGPPVSFTTEQPNPPPVIPISTTTTEIPEITTEFVITNENPQVEENPEDDQEGNVAVSTAVANQEQKGQYYILQPNGKLQRITYRTLPNPKNKSSPIVSNLKYETVKPIQDPIYSYNNGQLVRIN